MKKLYVILIIIASFPVGIFFAITTGSPHTSGKTSSTMNQNSSDNVVLDLRGKNLMEVSSAIYTKTDTTTLLLSNNSIQMLPSQMGRMTKVTVFKIDHNQLKGNLIGEIRQMTQLKNLDVSYNDMTGMPAELGQLNSLESLNYSHNHITGLPNELVQLKNNLKEFNLTGNPLSAAQVSKLKAALPNTNIIF